MAPAADMPGYWGTPTSTLDWCEENYVVSYYIAEFWNTVSNLIMILPPIYGAIQTCKDGLEVRYVWSFLGILLDELPMIYSCCVFVYCLYECFKQERAVNYLSITLLLTFSIIVSVLNKCINILSVLCMCRVYPWLRALGFTSLSVFLLGFVLWNIDNIFCDSLRATRQRLPPVVGAVTQLHAWWHILTGLGSYLHILLSLQIRSTYLKHRPKVKFLCGVWPILHIESQKAS
uniref:Alkaline ceramidase n=1 Tax=Sinocyclocheilus anshuiensis TaxID=1608454 RepID=A0A671LL57_9TELE